MRERERKREKEREIYVSVTGRPRSVPSRMSPDQGSHIKLGVGAERDLNLQTLLRVGHCSRQRSPLAKTFVEL